MGRWGGGSSVWIGNQNTASSGASPPVSWREGVAWGGSQNNVSRVVPSASHKETAADLASRKVLPSHSKEPDG